VFIEFVISKKKFIALFIAEFLLIACVFDTTNSCEKMVF